MKKHKDCFGDYNIGEEFYYVWNDYIAKMIKISEIKEDGRLVNAVCLDGKWSGCLFYLDEDDAVENLDFMSDNN